MSDLSNGVGKLLKCAEKDGKRTYLIILLSYEGALRVSELIHIRVKDFDFKKEVVSLVPVRKKDKTKGQCTLSSEALSAVQSYIKEYEIKSESFLFPGRTKRSCTLVSFDCTGGHISKRDVQLIFDRVAVAAGMKEKGRGIQLLKHARLVKAAKDTKDPHEIQKLGRYGSTAMSARYIAEV